MKEIIFAWLAAQGVTLPTTVPDATLLAELGKALAAQTAKTGADGGQTTALANAASRQALALANDDPRYKDRPFTPELYARILADHPALKEQLNQPLAPAVS